MENDGGQREAGGPALGEGRRGVESPPPPCLTTPNPVGVTVRSRAGSITHPTQPASGGARHRPDGGSDGTPAVQEGEAGWAHSAHPPTPSPTTSPATFVGDGSLPVSHGMSGGGGGIVSDAAPPTATAPVMPYPNIQPTAPLATGSNASSNTASSPPGYPVYASAVAFNMVGPGRLSGGGGPPGTAGWTALTAPNRYGQAAAPATHAPHPHMHGYPGGRPPGYLGYEYRPGGRMRYPHQPTAAVTYRGMPSAVMAHGSEEDDEFIMQQGGVSMMGRGGMGGGDQYCMPSRMAPGHGPMMVAGGMRHMGHGDGYGADAGDGMGGHHPSAGGHAPLSHHMPGGLGQAPAGAAMRPSALAMQHHMAMHAMPSHTGMRHMGGSMVMGSGGMIVGGGAGYEDDGFPYTHHPPHAAIPGPYGGHDGGTMPLYMQGPPPPLPAHAGSALLGDALAPDEPANSRVNSTNHSRASSPGGRYGGYSHPSSPELGLSPSMHPDAGRPTRRIPATASYISGEGMAGGVMMAPEHHAPPGWAAIVRHGGGGGMLLGHMPPGLSYMHGTGDGMHTVGGHGGGMDEGSVGVGHRGGRRWHTSTDDAIDQCGHDGGGGHGMARENGVGEGGNQVRPPHAKRPRRGSVTTAVAAAAAEEEEEEGDVHVEAVITTVGPRGGRPTSHPQAAAAADAVGATAEGDTPTATQFLLEAENREGRGGGGSEGAATAPSSMICPHTGCGYHAESRAELNHHVRMCKREMAAEQQPKTRRRRMATLQADDTSPLHDAVLAAMLSHDRSMSAVVSRAHMPMPGSPMLSHMGVGGGRVAPRYDGYAHPHTLVAGDGVGMYMLARSGPGDGVMAGVADDGMYGRGLGHPMRSTPTTPTSAGRVYVCRFPGCGYQCAHVATLIRHENACKHSSTSAGAVSQEGHKPCFACSFPGCTFRGTSREALKQHMATCELGSDMAVVAHSLTVQSGGGGHTRHTNGGSLHGSAGGDGGASKTTKTIACKYPACNYRSSKRSHVTRHELVCRFGPHNRSEEDMKPFKCPYPGCLFRSSQNCNLCRHMRVCAFGKMGSPMKPGDGGVASGGHPVHSSHGGGGAMTQAEAAHLASVAAAAAGLRNLNAAPARGGRGMADGDDGYAAMMVPSLAVVGASGGHTDVFNGFQGR